MIVSFDAAVQHIREGGCLVYPTETFFAIGGDAFQAGVGARIAVIKGRPDSKPLPVILGGWEQWERFVLPDPDAEEIARQFWPGSLSILVRLRGDVPGTVRDGQGWTSVRFTPHPVAARLCLESNTLLVATSANRSGLAAASSADCLDQGLVRDSGCLISDPPEPAGGLPSTLIRVLGPREVAVLRPGVLSVHALGEAGIKVRQEVTKI